MLGKIAKKLRIFGFDTEYLANTDDNTIIKMNFDKKRIILTKDRQLYTRISKIKYSLLSDYRRKRIREFNYHNERIWYQIYFSYHK